MQTFTDATGRQWSMVITVDTVRRVRSLAAVDLMQVVKGKLLEDLAGDPVLLVDVLFAICKPQADHQQVRPEDFAQGLVGDAIDAASLALVKAIADFFPSPTRKLLLRLSDASRAQRERMDALMNAQADKIAAMMDSTPGDSSPSAPESSGTIQAPTPSAS